MNLPFPLNTIDGSCILVVDDDVGFLSMFKWTSKQRWPQSALHTASTPEEAFHHLDSFVPDVIVLDLGLPPDPDNASEGLKILKYVYEHPSRFSNCRIVAYSGTTRQEHATECAKYGAYFISKSGEQSTLFSFIELMLSNAALRKAGEQQTANDYVHPLLVGSSELLRDAIKKTELVAATDISVLMLGESGTGKEVFAKLLHESSGRKGTFVALNCAAIPEDLLENELFGHEKGAFTGASSLKKGKVELAHGGTLFLDEIGDMPLSLQSKILRFLEEGVVDRVGGQSSIPVDVRVVCATHRNLKEMIEQNRFRSDLYYRLAKMTIELPPLRDRGQDVIALANFFLESTCKRYPEFHVDGFSDSAISAMLQHQWPGNIRELKNKIQSAVICCDRTKRLITASDLELRAFLPITRPAPIELNQTLVAATPDSVQNIDISSLGPLGDVVAKFEHQLICQALEASGQNVAEAARLLQISRSTLYSKFRDYDIRLKKMETKTA